MLNYKIYFTEINEAYYPDTCSYDVMSFTHEVGECFFIPRDAKMKNLRSD